MAIALPICGVDETGTIVMAVSLLALFGSTCARLRTAVFRAGNMAALVAFNAMIVRPLDFDRLLCQPSHLVS